MLEKSRKFAPSYHFLFNTGSGAAIPILKDRQITFLSAKVGFLHPQSPPKLKAPFEAWQKIALELPERCRNDFWEDIASQMPMLSGLDERLEDHHLPVANLCLGAIAHALGNIAHLPVPDSIIRPWKQVAGRLGNPNVSLSYYDIISNNFVIKAPNLRTDSITDVWSQVEPLVTLTGTRTEINFFKGSFCVEHSACQLPRAVSISQQAAVNGDFIGLRSALCQIIDLIHRICDTFMKRDSRIFSPFFVGQVEFGITINASALPVVEGEKTATGTQSLTIHLLDAFFCRQMYDSPFGNVVRKEQKWFSQLHLDFLASVQKMCVLKCIQSFPTLKQRDELTQLYRHGLEAYAGPQGFLGLHAKKVFGIISLSEKIGRVQSAGGIPLLKWKDEVHRRIFHQLQMARKERLQTCTTFFFDAKLSSRTRHKFPGLGNRYSIECWTTVRYRAGDVLAILPKNSNTAVDDILSEIGISESEPIHVLSPDWKNALIDWNLGRDGEEGSRSAISKIKVRHLLEIGDLTNISKYLARPYVIDEKHGRPKLEMSIKAKLEELVKPLKPRYYSIASTCEKSPTLIDFFTGGVAYKVSSSRQSSEGTMLRSIENKINIPVPVFKKSINQGVSSSFLEKLDVGSKLRVRIVTENGFHLPKDIHIPIVMFALGKGIAPFVSFLESMIADKRNGASREARKAWLILGVRTPGHMIFDDQLRKAVFQENVVRISVACSRAEQVLSDNPSRSSFQFVPGKRMRIQDLLAERIDLQQRLWDMLESGAHVYSCGNPELGPVVHQILSNVAMRFGSGFLKRSFKDQTTPIDELASRFPSMLSAEHRLHDSLFNGGSKRDVRHFFNFSDVAKHRSSKSAYSVLDEEVYDLTNYLQLHPGGARILLDVSGRDMTSDFMAIHGNDSISEFATLEAYKIGKLQRFKGASSRVQSLVTNWSEVLLRDVVRHSSVTLLNVNEFKSLESRITSDKFKSHLCSNRGQAFIITRFWEALEPDMFRTITNAFDWQMMDSSIRNGAFLTEIETAFDWVALRDQISTIRSTVVDSNSLPNISVVVERRSKLLSQMQLFVSDLVDVFIEVQMMVEKACTRSETGVDDTTVLRNMFSEIFEYLPAGFAGCYRNYPSVS